MAVLYQPQSRRWVASDLAPGDGKSRGLDSSAFSISEIHSSAHPGFPGAYQALRQEFGAAGELETEAVLARRFHWRMEPPQDGWMLRYEMATVSDRNGALAAVRDHSVMIPPLETTGNVPLALVHLSHLLVAPGWRRSGLAGWMRAMPLQMARACLRSLYGTEQGAFITLVAEMDPPEVDQAENLPRLAAYEKAGFRAIDPAEIRYFQPDFAPPEAIAARGRAIPLPMRLVIRRVGREQETSINGAEVRRVVGALYRMYADGCQPEDICGLSAEMEAIYPRAGQPVRLVPPTPPST